VLLPRRRRQGAVEIGDQIVGIFGSDRHAHNVRRCTRSFLLFRRELPVGGGGGVDDQAARVAEICHVAEDLKTIHKFYTGLIAPLDGEGEQRPGAARADRGHPAVVG
jgi:hypothetical protein